MRKIFCTAGLLFGFLIIVAGLVFSSSLGTRVDKLIGPDPQCSWPTTRGTITGSELHNDVRMNGEDDWKFAVKFTYEVEGIQYSAEQNLRDFLVVETPNIPKFTDVSYIFQTCANLPNSAEATTLFRAAHDKSHFFPGLPVVVYYNPTKNEEAVLAPGLLSGYAMTFGEGFSYYFALCLVVGGIALMFVSFRALRRLQRSYRSV